MIDPLQLGAGAKVIMRTKLGIAGIAVVALIADQVGGICIKTHTTLG